MHVVDPDAYPLSANAAYIPKPHSLAQAQAFESSLGLHNIVLVQPSIYGTDNACLLSALHALGPSRARAVVAFDPASTPEKVLREWHAAGVRGVRVNLVSQGGPTPTADELAVTLHRYAEVLRPLGWVLQLYVPLALVDVLEPLVPELDVRVVIDHLGLPSLPRAEDRGAAEPALDPYELPGFAALVRLLRAGQTFVKLSAPYRISRAADYSDLEPVAKEILRVAGQNRVVFATDWPHTRFDGLDIRPWVEKVFDLCGDDAALVGRIFRGNAEDLWDVQPQEAAE